METTLYNISQVVGVAVIHSLWQGLFVYLGLRLIILLFPQLSAATRHNVAMTGLAWITVWFIYTLSTEINNHTWVVINAHNKDILPAVFGMPLHLGHDATLSTRYNYAIEWLMPYVTIVYMIGLLFNTGQLVWSRKKINHIRQTMSIDVQLQLKVDQFVKMLNITDKVRFGLSRMVEAPCMVGYFKPVILLPFTLSTYLSAEEMEIIILHELAHIKRNDYLINLAQQAMSVLLFFNPFAQLINRIINHERENSCDDIVIEASKKPLVYAHALLKLEQTRQQEWQLALAATGKKYHLLNRIERIMKTKKPIGNTRHILLALSLLVASVTGLAWLNPTIANGKISFNKIKPTIISTLFADTTKKKTSTYHHKSVSAKKATVKAKHAEEWDTYGYAYDDKELEKLSTEVGKYGEAIGKYYNSPEFKKLTEEMGEKGKEMGDFYNKPELKELQDKMQELSANFSKNWGENSESTKLSGRMGELGGEIGKYYSTPEFKKLNEELEKKYGIPHDRNNDYEFRDNENYKKYQEELRSHISPAEKEREAEIKKLGEQMKAHYDSPEMRKAQDDMRLMGDSLKKAYHNPNMEKVKEDMRRLGEQMRAYQNSPDMKRMKEDMRKAEARMKAYMKSPEFKRKMERMKRDAMNFKINLDENMNMNMNMDKPEKPEPPEKPEISKPEAPEKPEIGKPEAPEKPEAPDNQ
ncbi:M56 family metallopeptidase [Mucilaginibacter sp. BT774]|uniref:M56 family metallopeptidase n=1 Tax=Mucilaginibacter sp. BT774 TaxID=3062276 RepID=UPI002674C7A4|nr:M56 family metallopeptidase [Mucilaginibacter sp. BT774]MDO3629127.1 M56 family metallopeptidase [Mucilaginibacter sp. BT774]